MSKNADKYRRWYELFETGKSYREIAAIEGEGTTHNMVAGAIFRHRQKHSKPGRPKDAPVSKSGAPIKVKNGTGKVKKDQSQAKPYNMTIEQLGPKDCRYPYGDGPYTFCGNSCATGTPYCPEHHALTRQKIDRIKNIEEWALKPWKPAAASEASARARGYS